MTNSESPVLLRFPLRGEWMALRTPAAGAPTHGTELLGQRYAYDFVRATGRGAAPFGANRYQHAFGLVPASAFAGWDAPVFAAQSGTVEAVGNDWPDARWLNGVAALLRLRFFHCFRPVRITATDWRALAGNYLVIRGASGMVFYAHLRQGSITHAVGDQIRVGEEIGRVGNSGRSSMPHLHFHLMDRAAPDARGILCGFDAFEVWDGAEWRGTSGLPSLRARFRAR